MKNKAKPILDQNTGSKEFGRKSPEQQQLINETLQILSSLGIPFSDLTPRRLERMALAFLAVADVRSLGSWVNLKDVNSGRSLKTRDIINYLNEHYGESISSGSYDDIRRQDLKLCVLAGIVVQTKPLAARNDPERGYALSSECAEVVRTFGTEGWTAKLEQYCSTKTLLSQQLSAARKLNLVSVKLPQGGLEFSPGKHNELQKAIIEKLLPRYGYGAEVLYVGDTADRAALYKKERMEELGIPALEHGELPDVIAYSEQKNWIYMIEAVYTSGPISPTRLMVLKKLTSKCTAQVVYITAFLDRQTFRKYADEIAWETEVWIEEDQDHLIHFNGDKFL